MSSRVYSQDNFRDQKIDNCICSICSDVIFRAKGSENCCHIYCEDCITKWSQTSMSCPQCKEKLKLVNNKYFENTSISPLKYTCLNVGCEKTFDVGADCRNIINHNLECQFVGVVCDICTSECIKNDLVAHKNSIACKDAYIGNIKSELECMTRQLDKYSSLLKKQEDKLLKSTIDYTKLSNSYDELERKNSNLMNLYRGLKGSYEKGCSKVELENAAFKRIFSDERFRQMVQETPYIDNLFRDICTHAYDRHMEGRIPRYDGDMDRYDDDDVYAL